MFRVGIGFDVHRLVDERRLILGGVVIPFEKGLLGHSDADVLTHAVCDAILGALRLGDIGRHFPDSDPAYTGISSMILLERVRELMAGREFRLANLDTVVIAQRPKLHSYIAVMQDKLAAALRTSADRVNVKATTTEGLGYTGRGEGIAAQAVVQLIHVDFFQSERF
ncbi:2-C-methyl-D-erythritol 2,4-cyclodiphosphate synthase [candidate division KSB3 bacterium]|uniref:2-C-methyl-D-erythritol 2,4-cyclodiphosphate synthase n=1 Tax=candidate division KSB3 bacterium TaxID=2044937 RepID=A0A2G6EB28_9BACT|nr:MAG: 2-C-methyl-D-erythritol 2,4-cyclodiphosphate synthase [candidate division KSB3 bacterium]PIE30787.1 MAG: 2-C-methyl-D-erythritol 2,4-cyclodiphosphate synthase [candidate division KSB3 bacterium]